MRMRWMAGWLLLATSGAFAQHPPRAWKTVADAGNSCSYAVPSDWTEDHAHPGIATSPDGKSTVVPIPLPQPFSDAKKTAAQKMPPLKVLQNSPHRYWFAYHDPADGEDSPDTHWLVAVAGKSHVCAVQITFKSASGDALGKKIVNAIRTLD